LEPSTALTQVIKDPQSEAGLNTRIVRIVGHVSRPVFGEGRQTPDRQLFFVNGRPCGLPQIAKAFNDVYKSFNISQSPFIFADLRIDTNAYDVNVSPDKRTILLHDQNALLESLKSSLTQLFEGQNQTVPQSQLMPQKLPAFRPPNINREVRAASAVIETTPLSTVPLLSLNAAVETSSSPVTSSETQEEDPTELLKRYIGQDLIDRQHVRGPKALHSQIQAARDTTSKAVQDFNDRIASQRNKTRNEEISNLVPLENTIPMITVSPRSSMPGPVQLAYDRSRPRRFDQEVAVITVGDKITSAIIGGPSMKRVKTEGHLSSQAATASAQASRFAQSLRAFSASGTQAVGQESENEDEDDIDIDIDFEPSDSGKTVEPEQDASDNDLSASEDQEINHDVDFSNDTDDAPSLSNLAQDSAHADSDDEYIDEDERKRKDEAQVEEMVRQAEAAAAHRTHGSRKKIAALLRSSPRGESTTSLVQNIDTSVLRIGELLNQSRDILRQIMDSKEAGNSNIEEVIGTQESAEERLSLTISKADFAEMHIVGQFNLGFILATRSASQPGSAGGAVPSDDLFIVDQHASDEIFNFHRLSATTSLTPQPLVKPHRLNLTAIEEETVMSSLPTLQKNGFTLTIDESGDEPVGSRCKLLALPTSRETTFDLRDLEEMISLLGESSLTSTAAEVVRPSKVRKMLAMRACRGSVMVGRTLTHTAMERVLRHMGQIDKPWNCPHGRPTMRHLVCLDTWQGWSEGEGVTIDQKDDEDVRIASEKLNWSTFLARTQKRQVGKVPINTASNENHIEEDVQDEEVEAESMVYDEDEEEGSSETLFIGDGE